MSSPASQRRVLESLDAARNLHAPDGGWPLASLAEAPTFQLAALAVYLRGQDGFADLLDWLEQERPAALLIAKEAVGDCDPGERLWSVLNSAIVNGDPLPREELAILAAGLVDDTIDRDRLAAWLALSVRSTWPTTSEERLTFALRDSGTVVDLRAALAPIRLVRRYPTGSVSEKVALVLPALLSLVRKLGVASPVIVARSLGFAGGTWDKLARIPDFEFREPHDLERPLRSNGVCYTVPDELAPADRALYSFRAATGTVECSALIASSIASKHLALPVEDLLLDIQFGASGFVPDRAAGVGLTRSIADIARPAGMAVSSLLRDSLVPTGSCIGAAVEVWEALAVLGADGPAYRSLDRRFVEAQRQVSSEIFARLLRAVPQGRSLDARAFARDSFRTGAALSAFLSILSVHSVAPDTVTKLLTAPLQVLGCGPERTVVRSPRSGRVSHVDRRRLGLIVNVELAASTNPYLRAAGRSVGIQLHVTRGDRIGRHAPLCTVHGAVEDLSAIADCIEVVE